MVNKNQMVAVSTALMLAATAALAQTSPVRPTYAFPEGPSASGPASMRLGDSPLYFSPYLGLAAGHDDNLFLTNENEKESSILIVSPGFKLDARSANSVFLLDYQGQAARYTSSREDDYVDHTMRSTYDVAFDRRNFLRLGLDYIRSHDPRGATDRPIGDSPDRYRLTTPSITYAFGSPGAQGRVELFGSFADKRYTNNREVTFLSDRETTDFGGAFFWRVQPKTHLLLEARRTEIDYDSDLSPLDSEEDRYYAGVTWEATALTTGTLKAGRLKKRFDSGRPEFSGGSWEALVTWSPRTYSKFDFYSSRTTNESTGLGDFILSEISGVTWNHAWSSFWQTQVALRHQKDKYQGFDRKDDTTSLGFKLGYKFRRWLTLGAEYTHSTRDSNIPQFEYDKNLYLFTVTGTL